MRHHVVYLITNAANEKYYVGYTKDFSTRWREHCYPSASEENRHLSRAIKKSGAASFKHEILAENLTREEAIDLEKLWITLLESSNPKIGYNLTLGGEGLGNPSPETRRKMSLSQKGLKRSQISIQRRAASIRETWKRKRELGIPLCSQKEAARLRSLSKKAAEARWSKRVQVTSASLTPVIQEAKSDFENETVVLTH